MHLPNTSNLTGAIKDYKDRRVTQTWTCVSVYREIYQIVLTFSTLTHLEHKPMKLFYGASAILGSGFCPCSKLALLAGS